MAIRMPDFFVVGAQKAGTTTLHEWLEQSVEIAMPWTKETHFFRDEEKFGRGAGWYLQQFKSLGAQTKVVGEIDPEYMYFPECSARIKSVTRAPKLIFVLRDPLSRARSHFQMSVRRGYEPLSFFEALNAEAERLRQGTRFSRIHHSYIDRGLYAKQIQRMLAEFPDSETLVLLFDDLFASQAAATESLKNICAFLGVSQEGLSVDVSVRENQASEPRFSFLRDFIYGQGKIKKLLGKFVPSQELKLRIMKLLERMNTRPLRQRTSGKNKEKHEVPAFVYREFIGDLRKLEQLVNLDLSKWIAEYERTLAQ